MAWTFRLWVCCISVTTLGSPWKKWNTCRSSFVELMAMLAWVVSVRVRRLLNRGILNLFPLSVRTGPNVVLTLHLGLSYLCTIETQVLTLSVLLVI